MIGSRVHIYYEIKPDRLGPPQNFPRTHLVNRQDMGTSKCSRNSVEFNTLSLNRPFHISTVLDF